MRLSRKELLAIRERGSVDEMEKLVDALLAAPKVQIEGDPQQVLGPLHQYPGFEPKPEEQ